MTDAETLKDLILWARMNGVRLSQVSIGTIAVAMDDVSQADAKAPRALDATPATHADALRRWGGELIKDFETKMGEPSDANTTYIDEDDA